MHLFKEETGIPFREYLVHLRIETAKNFLVTSDQKISQLALRLGFDNGNYFSTVFKKYTGMTPRSYRQKHKVAIEP
jgi:two-component system, response regulator YesN